MKKRLLQLMAFFLITVVYSQDNDIKLSLDKLFSLKVTSVSGTAMDMTKSPAAIYVITPQDFKEQGHRTIADALRAVPGFHVRKLNSSKFAVSARGNNGRFANKLLVLIDGRSVYTPLFSGVYWEIQDLPIEDIARIEVIRGPGATLWGANAVNGVINIITKDVRDSLGGYAKLGLGNVDNYESEFRYGWQLSDNTFYKVWSKSFDRGESLKANGRNSNDSWDATELGMKMDWYASAVDTHSFIFNYSKLNVGDEFDILRKNSLASGLGGFGIPDGTQLYDALQISSDNTWETANLIWRWTSLQNSTDGWSLQSYIDYTKNEDVVYGEKRNTYDIDFRNWFEINDYNSFIWGIKYRASRDKFYESDTVFLDPAKRLIYTLSSFVQNTTTYRDWSFMYGTKIEYNDQTGIEIQPSVRLTYEYKSDTIFWASWSRAVRRPSRGEEDVSLFQPAQQIPGGLFLAGFASGNRDLDSEELLAYELGVRTEFFNKVLIIDLSGFYNDYNTTIDFSALETDPLNPFKQNLNNNENSQSYGIELSAKFNINKKWGILANYTWFRSNNLRNTVSDAEHQVFFNSSYQLHKNLSLHTNIYYAGNIPSLDLKPNVNWDVGAIWKVKDNFEISIWGKNLLDSQHPEGQVEFFNNQTLEIPRSVFVEATYRF